MLVVRSQLDTTNRAYDLQTEMANQLQSKISILEENIITKGKQILDLENSLTKEHEQKVMCHNKFTHYINFLKL